MLASIPSSTRRGARKMTRRSSTRIARLVTLAAAAALATAVTVETQEPRNPRNVAEFDAMFQELNNWGRWGADDELGTMNLITPEKTREAAALVQRGITVSLAHNPMPDPAPDNPDTAFNHTMAESLRSDTYEFRYHGYGVSHIDSLCHFLWNDRMYNDIPPSASSLEEGLRQARHPEPEAGHRDARHPARLRAPEGRAVPGAADADLRRGHRGLGRDGRGHGVAGRRHLRGAPAAGRAAPRSGRGRSPATARGCTRRCCPGSRSAASPSSAATRPPT